MLAEEDARLAQQATGPSTRASVEGKRDVRFALVAPYRPASAQAQPASAQTRSARSDEAVDDAGQAREASSEAGRGGGRGGWVAALTRRGMVGWRGSSRVNRLAIYWLSLTGRVKGSG
jgi:hypothetical protein